jgi:hypothetical protein
LGHAVRADRRPADQHRGHHGSGQDGQGHGDLQPTAARVRAGLGDQGLGCESLGGESLRIGR